MTKKLAVRYRWEEDGSCTFFTPDGREVVQSPEAAEGFIATLKLLPAVHQQGLLSLMANVDNAAETAGKGRAEVLAAMFSISKGGRND